MGSIEAMTCVKPAFTDQRSNFLALADWVLSHFRVRLGIGVASGTCVQPIIPLTLADDLNATPDVEYQPAL